MNEIDTFIALSALGISVIIAIGKMFDKSLSIREHEAYKDAVERDIHRVEVRLSHLEQTRPTTGELEILSDAVNKRIDEIINRQINS